MCELRGLQFFLDIVIRCLTARGRQYHTGTPG